MKPGIINQNVTRVNLIVSDIKAKRGHTLGQTVGMFFFWKLLFLMFLYFLLYLDIETEKFILSVHQYYFATPTNVMA